MQIGVVVPQGWSREYAGFTPDQAWARTAAVAADAERLGFESIWLFDHFHTVPEPTDELTFESFSTLAAPDGVPAKITMRFSTGSKTADALRRPDGMGPEAGVRLIHVWACASVMVDRATRVDRATVRRMGRPPKPRVQCDT